MGQTTLGDVQEKEASSSSLSAPGRCDAVKQALLFAALIPTVEPCPAGCAPMLWPTSLWLRAIINPVHTPTQAHTFTHLDTVTPHNSHTHHHSNCDVLSTGTGGSCFWPPWIWLLDASLTQPFLPAAGTDNWVWSLMGASATLCSRSGTEGCGVCWRTDPCPPAAALQGSWSSHIPFRPCPPGPCPQDNR